MRCTGNNLQPFLTKVLRYSIGLRLKRSYLIGNLMLIVQIGSFLLLIASGQTVFSILNTTFSQGGSAPIEVDPITKLATISFIIEPNNSGYLESHVTISVRMISDQQSITESNTTTFSLQPGATKKTTLILKISSDKLQQYTIGGAKLELTTDIRTLNNLVGLEYKVLI